MSSQAARFPLEILLKFLGFVPFEAPLRGDDLDKDELVKLRNAEKLDHIQRVGRLRLVCLVFDRQAPSTHPKPYALLASAAAQSVLQKRTAQPLALLRELKAMPCLRATQALDIDLRCLRGRHAQACKVLDFLSSLSTLTSLSLGLVHTPLPELHRLQNLGLEHLEIFSQLAKTTGAIPVDRIGLRRLVSFTLLGQNALPSYYPSTISALRVDPAAADLRTLAVHHMTLGTEGVRDLERSGAIGSLVELSLVGVGLVDVSVLKVGDNKTLLKLDLSYNPIIHLGRLDLDRNMTLQHLTLARNNRFMDSSSLLMGLGEQLVANKTLKSLSLAECSLVWYTLNELTIVGNTTLESLDLRRNPQLKEADLRRLGLEQCDSLVHIDLRGIEGLETYREQLRAGGRVVL